MKKIIAIIVSLLFMTGLHSCEEQVTATHRITYEEGSVNFKSNLYLQHKVSTEVNSVETFFGSEKDAISWFDEKMNYLESEAFANAEPQVPVLGTTEATFVLLSSYDPDKSDSEITQGREVKRRTVSFKEHSIM